MPGGLLQLKSVGDENDFINTKPDINFFKNMYMRHTNFVKNFIEVKSGFDDKLDLNNTTKIKIKIPRNGDLISHMFLKLDLPDIYSSVEKSFQFIDNIGSIIIQSAKLMIEENIIQDLHGEYIHLHSMLYNKVEKTDIINDMSGNTPDINNPTGIRDNTYRGFDSVLTSNGKINKHYNNKPSIVGKTLYIPLPFWFTKTYGLSLPLIALKYHTVYLDLELRPLKDLVTIIENGTRTSPNLSSFDINSFLGGNEWYINPRLDIEYVFLDNTERNMLVKQYNMYLIEQVQYRSAKNISGKKFIEMQLYHPVKEILIFARKSNPENRWTEFSDNSESIIKDMKLFYDGNERLEKKPVEYFTNMQYFMHHSNSNPDNVLKYSFALEPELFQPTGICNFSEMHKIGFDINIKNDTLEKYDLYFYFLNYNLLDIRHGMGGIVYGNN